MLVPDPAKPQFPRCPQCHGPLTLGHHDTKYAYCFAADCPVDGLPAGEVALDHQQTAPGLPRPILDGRPVAWVTAVIGPRVAWTALNDVRRQEAAESWLCQICGNRLGTKPTAWLAISAGDVDDGGAMHDGCRDLARKVCPTLRVDPTFVYVEVRRDDQARDWAAVVDRLAAYNIQHRQLPTLVPYALLRHTSL